MILPFPSSDKNLIAEISNKDEEFPALLKRLRLSENQIVGMWQEHTDHVRWAGKKDRGVRFTDTDGLIAAEKGVFLSVRVDDCVPVLYFDPQTKVVAASHCGWRGIMNGLAKKIVEEMACEGIDTKDLLIVFGPAARVCCYEVGEALANDFKKEFGISVVEKRNGKFFLNLQLCLQVQLESTGVSQKNIFDSQICTIHNSDKWNSFRADNKKGNKVINNVALIGYLG